MSSTYAMILTPIRGGSPIRGGWAVSLTDGRRLASFRGPLARSRAMRYLAQATGTRSGLRALR